MAVKVGYGRVETNITEDSISDEKKAEVKRVFEKKEVYLPKEREEEFLKEFDCVVVHSFGDWNDDYHLSEEEREKNTKYYEAATNLRRMKKIHRRIESFIVAVRETFKVINIIAETNGVYSKEKFLKMYYKGDIELPNIRFPKYRGKDRKKINWEYLTEFIMSDEEPSKFNASELDIDEDEDLTDEEKRSRYFTDEEWNYIQTPLTNDETRYEIELFDVKEDDPGNTNTVIDYDSSESKKLIKSSPELAYMIKDIRKRKKLKDNIKSLQSYGYNDSIYADIRQLEEYDQKYDYTSKDDIPEFHGNLLNNDDYYKYMMKLDEYEKTHKKVNVNGKMRTLKEAEELELKASLEAAGWNILKFASNREAKNKIRKGIKNAKKKQKIVKQRLIELKERKERKNRTMKDSENLDDQIKKLKKKKLSSRKKVDKLEKKLKDKRIKDKKKAKDRLKKRDRIELMRDAEDNITSRLLASSSRPEESFDDWEEKALDLRSIFDEV